MRAAQNEIAKMNSLTLVITAHRTNFLNEAVLSVLAQTSTDFNLLCCADIRTSEAPHALFNGLVASAPMTVKHVLAINGNGTAGYVRNAAFAATDTRWVAFLDGDDFLHPRAVKIVNEAIAEFGEHTRIFSTGLYRVDRTGVASPKPDSLRYYPPRWLYDHDPDEVGHLTYFNHFQVVRRDAWQDYPYDETTNGEDIDFLLHQLLLGRYTKIEHYLYYFRDTPESFSGERYEDSDICTQRYRSKYYLALRRKHSGSAFLELNFAKDSNRI